MAKMRASFTFISLVLLAVGCNRQDTERLGSIGKKIAAQAEAATAPLRQEWGAQLPPLGTSAESRVSARLRWDKSLADARIEVRATPEAIELKGNVNSEEQRRRAVQIAESTTGVSKVSDSLQVAEK